ncbi:GNAT family N-acetyltransferase [Bacillus spongiae]|uniref:GNAT family N-acetyltransferase n=1 Tax=Bacillus spongiae TaxID=2683610 RepID=A0ABU8HJI0_9BACI
MTKIKNRHYVIRNYTEEDADKIAQFNVVLMLTYCYNGDYKPENIFCAVDQENTIMAVGHLEFDQTWSIMNKTNQSIDYVYKLNLDISISNNGEWSSLLPIREELMNCLITRANEIKNQFPERNIRVCHNISTDKISDIDYYLSKGFMSKRSQFVMKRDLTEEIKNVPHSDKIRIINWKMKTKEEEKQYLRAEAKGDLEGISWSLNRLRWTKGGPEWDTFTAFAGEDVVGSVMTWGISENRSATESIFVLPEWRQKGIAKAVITEALKFLKEKGKSEATLCVLSDNYKAIALYQSLGYKIDSVFLEFGFDLSS